MKHQLASALAKIQRANENILNLNMEVRRFLDDTKPTMLITDHEQPGQKIISASAKMPPLRFSVLAGEIIHHLRSSLDHVAHQLVLQNGSVPTTKTEFPIFVTRDQYIARSEAKVEGMSDPAKALIDSLQPFHTPHPAALDHPLWRIHEMDIADKHKLLVILATRGALDHIISHGDWDERSSALDILRVSPGPLSSNANTVLAHIRVRENVHVQPYVSHGVVFDKVGTSNHESVIPLLQQLSDSSPGPSTRSIRFLRNPMYPYTGNRPRTPSTEMG